MTAILLACQLLAVPLGSTGITEVKFIEVNCVPMSPADPVRRPPTNVFAIMQQAKVCGVKPFRLVKFEECAG